MNMSKAHLYKAAYSSSLFKNKRLFASDDLPVTLSTIMQDIIDDKSVNVSRSILHQVEGVDLLPSNIELSGLEVRLINAISRESVLKTCVNEVKKIMTMFLWTVCRVWVC